MASDDHFKNSADISEKFSDLIDSDNKEQIYQSYMEKNSQLIPREFVQNHGLHFDLVLRKLPFGADFKTDFFYMSKSSADWNLVFIEIEKPKSKYFRGGSNSFSTEFSAALQQIGLWRAWLSEPANLSAFMASIEAIWLPSVMRRNPLHPKFVLVHGRRSEFFDNEQRRRLIHAQEREDFKILSFDSLTENLHHRHPCYVGARYNDHIEIFGHEMRAPEIFGWVEPSQFAVSSDMREVIRKGHPSGVSIRRSDGNEFVNAFPYFADRVRIVRSCK